MINILSFRIFISYSQKVMPLKATMTYFTKIIGESKLSKMIFVKIVHRQSPVNLLVILSKKKDLKNHYPLFIMEIMIKEMAKK